MCQHQHPHHRHSIFCILPPYLLRAVAQNGTPAQRAAATTTLATDETFRALARQPERADAAAQPAPARPWPQPVKQRTIYSANNVETLPGTVIRAEGSAATGDPAVDEAYDGLGHTWDFYQEAVRPQLDRRRGLAAQRHGPLRAGLQQRLLEWRADGVRRRRRGTVQPLHHRARRDRPRTGPRRHRGRGRPGLHVPAGRPQRASLGCLRRAGQAEGRWTRRPTRPTG